MMMIKFPALVLGLIAGQHAAALAVGPSGAALLEKRQGNGVRGSLPNGSELLTALLKENATSTFFGEPVASKS
jgi:hypothetical protein